MEPPLIKQLFDHFKRKLTIYVSNQQIDSFLSDVGDSIDYAQYEILRNYFLMGRNLPKSFLARKNLHQRWP